MDEAAAVNGLSPAQVARYREQGFLALDGFFGPDEAAEWAAECERLWRLPGVVHRDNLRTHVLASDKEMDRLDPVIDLSPVLGDVARSRRIAAVAGRLLGDEPLLFKDKLIFKPPGTAGYKTHQDYAYWHWLPAPPDALLTVMVAVDAAAEGNGAVEFVPGLHGRLLTPEGRPGDIDDAAIDVPGRVLRTEPGDVVVFHSLTPHRSGANRSPAMRRQLYLSYGAARHGDLYQRYYAGLHGAFRQAMAPVAREQAFFR